jgi:hypothetical protein
MMAQCSVEIVSEEGDVYETTKKYCERKAINCKEQHGSRQDLCESDICELAK